MSGLRMDPILAAALAKLSAVVLSTVGKSSLVKRYPVSNAIPHRRTPITHSTESAVVESEAAMVHSIITPPKIRGSVRHIFRPRRPCGRERNPNGVVRRSLNNAIYLFKHYLQVGIDRQGDDDEYGGG